MQRLLLLTLILTGCNSGNLEKALTEIAKSASDEEKEARSDTDNAAAQVTPVTNESSQIATETPKSNESPKSVDEVKSVPPEEKPAEEIIKPKIVSIQICEENASEQQQHNINSQLHLKTKMTSYDDFSRDFLISYFDNRGDARIKDFAYHQSFTGKEVPSEQFDIKAPLNANSTYGKSQPNIDSVPYFYIIRWYYASDAAPKLFTETPGPSIGTAQPLYYFECKTQKF